MSISEICPFRKYVHFGNMSISEKCPFRKYVHFGKMSISEICPFRKYVHFGNMSISEIMPKSEICPNRKFCMPMLCRKYGHRKCGHRKYRHRKKVAAPSHEAHKKGKKCQLFFEWPLFGLIKLRRNQKVCIVY